MYIILLSKRKIKMVIAITIFVLVLLLGVFFGRSQIMVPAVTPGERLVPIYFVDTPEKKVAFSFDASWGAERTGRILEILREHDIKTTFFITGFWIAEYPEHLKKISDEGHEIGNHTATHPHLNSLTAEQIRQELKEVERMIKEVSGQQPTLFRPPFGEYNNTVITVAEDLGYKTIQWSIDSLDWQNLSKDEIVQRVTDRSHKGAIILFHNNGLHTADALPEIIEYYHKHNYEIVPISELIYHDDYQIDPNTGAQIKKRKPAD